MPKKVLMSWSSGKDSAWALYTLQNDPNFEVVGLYTTVNKKFDRVAMHAVRVELLKLQAESLGLPIEIIELPFPCSNEAYESIMRNFLETVQKRDVEAMAFGDLYLEDIRKYREDKLKDSGYDIVSPIWGCDTKELSEKMITAGVKTVVTCVDPSQLDVSFCGRMYNKTFLEDLPEQVDPCGENGEFHSFVFDGPMFKWPVPVVVGEAIERDGFVFTDIVKAGV
jgi:uncharacterized protein (TIGR00290 family)